MCNTGGSQPGELKFGNISFKIINYVKVEIVMMVSSICPVISAFLTFTGAAVAQEVGWVV